jgi:hypothetical protein
VTLTFPAGAVAEPTAVTIVPLAPAADRWMGVDLEPEGMIFHRPFTLSVELPNSVDLTDPRLFLVSNGESIPLQTDVDGNARTLTTSALSFFGFRSDGTISFPALTARLFSVAGGGSVTAGPQSCQARAARAQGLFRSFQAQGDNELAVAAALAAAADLQDAACPEEAAEWLTLASTEACEALTEVETNLNAAGITAHGVFEANASQLMDWAALAQRYAPECPALDTWGTTLEDETGDFLRFFSERLKGLSGNDFSTYQDLKEEAVQALELEGLAQTLGLLPQVAVIDEQAFKPAVAAMRETAYDLCQSDGWHYPISRLTPTGFFAARDIIGQTPPRPGPIHPAPSEYAGLTAETVFADLNGCATALEVQGATAQGAISSSTPIGGGSAPGQSIFTGEVDVPVNGQIRLEGSIGAFTCWNDVAADNEVVVALEGTEILSLARGAADEYLQGTPAIIPAADAADAAGIQIEPGVNSRLTVRRQRTACDQDMWGPAEYTLADLTVNWTQGVDFSGTYNGTYSGFGGCNNEAVSGDVQFTIGLEGEDLQVSFQLDPPVEGLEFYSGIAQIDFSNPQSFTGTITEPSALTGSFNGELSEDGRTLSGTSQGSALALCENVPTTVSFQTEFEGTK